MGEVDAAQARAQGHPAAPVRLVQGVALGVREDVGGHENAAPGGHVPDARRVLGEGAQHNGFGGQDLGRARVFETVQDRADPTDQPAPVDDERLGLGDRL